MKKLCKFQSLLEASKNYFELISILFLIGLTIIFLKGDKNILNKSLLSLIAVVVIRFYHRLILLLRN